MPAKLPEVYHFITGTTPGERPEPSRFRVMAPLLSVFALQTGVIGLPALPRLRLRVPELSVRMLIGLSFAPPLLPSLPPTDSEPVLSVTVLAPESPPTTFPFTTTELSMVNVPKVAARPGAASASPRRRLPLTTRLVREAPPVVVTVPFPAPPGLAF